MKLNWIIFVTGWMSFRAVGSGLFLFWIFTENERSAPSEWIVPFVGDFISGITALLLVFVDVLKELPATLILRPFNFNTLAVRTFELANEERLADAALPALAIVIVGIIPVIMISNLISRSRPGYE